MDIEKAVMAAKVFMNVSKSFCCVLLLDKEYNLVSVINTNNEQPDNSENAFELVNMAAFHCAEWVIVIRDGTNKPEVDFEDEKSFINHLDSMLEAYGKGLLDYLIISKSGYRSFAEEGIIFELTSLQRQDFQKTL